MITALRRRTPVQRRLLAEAVLLLPRAAWAIRRAEFPDTVAFGAVPLGQVATAPLRDILWAVNAAARRMPFRAACFERGLTVQRMLRHRGENARLHYGIAPGNNLEAHVWVSLAGEIVQGGQQAPAYREVGRWP